MNFFLQEFPRNLSLELSDVVQVLDENASWPNANSPGIYVMLDQSMNLLYIGKASCGANIGRRLGKYFDKTGKTRSGMEKFIEVKYVSAIPVPPERAFEVPSIEEYLISKLNPTLNVAGRVRE
ncbi:GIY-YIG nuclease family protein [Mariniblastus sp.]|nr:GIY-YIG nuclease family protein [Mariniblastus sp.]